ncbi:uncharacterized protein LACBIDRAFT_331606 [Laccaria bicolor S238N-H82]|uniref:Predicted protein n=1 Tax=Laccaria bicolor (strain S238N-H82 / ATCC MYA-4686) TaxID=486041 RepID=B0DPZ7_LACBS|nr:uncharacterized protein LACBIDRAFT_331606 [Laccaria bicolor S238N-H82]EDR03298.1 predicted protein [Laccaria bicolor S238N-H82]|eukprot:XP_001886094.1 predicted protein [Laccaria bicolor S238N-H82]
MFIPDKDAGGRKGRNIFVSLMRAVKLFAFSTFTRLTFHNEAFHDPIRYAWAKRHTKDSWQERYKKNAAALDARISEIVALEKPNPRQLWPQDRRLNKGAARRRSAHIELEEEEEEEEEEEDGPEMDELGEEEPETGGPEQEELGGEGEERETGRPEEPIEGGVTETSRRKRKSGNEPVSKASLKRKRVDQQDIVSSRSKGPSNGDEGQRTEGSQDFVQEAEDGEPSLHNSLFSAVDYTFNEPSSPEPQEHAAASSNSTPPTNSALLPTQTTLVGTSPIAPTQPSKRRRTTEARSYPAEPEAPYRNTRSRSRSVQPPVRPAPPKRRGTKRKTDDAGDKPPLEPVNEAFNDDKVNPVEPDNVEVIPATPDDVEFSLPDPGNAPDNADVPVPETLMEEMYVEDQLLADNSVLSALTNRDTISQARVTRHRTISMATDDAQTHIALRARPLPAVPSSRASSAFEIDPAHMLMQFERATTRVSLPLLNPHPPGVQASHSHPRQSEPFPRHLRSMTPVPSTPVPNVASRKRKESTSSVDSFPVAGTRASAVKKKLEQQEKTTPYKPPAGSRAAQRLAEMARQE